MHRRLFITLLSLLPFAPFAAEPRPISELDLFRFTWIGDPQVSADGAYAAFVRVTVNEKHDGYETSLWSVPLSGRESPRRLTAGPHDSAPRWSPDGKWLAFVRGIEKDGKPLPGQIHLLPRAGGEPFALTELPNGAQEPAWSPDGSHVAFLSDTSPEDLEKAKCKSQIKGAPGNPAAVPACPDERESDVRVITRAEYRFNGQGYLDPKRTSHLWVIDTPKAPDEKPQPHQLTRGRYEESNILWAPDGVRLYYTTVLLEEPYFELPRADLWAVPAGGGEPAKILSLGIDILSPALSPDGTRLAFRSNENLPIRSYAQPDLYVVELTPAAKPRNLTEKFDWDVGGGVGGDQAAPRAAGETRPLWNAGGTAIIDVVAREGRANLYRFPLDGGEPTPMTRGDQAVQRYSSGDGGHGLVALISTPVSIGDLFAVGEGDPRRLTDLNGKLMAELKLPPPEEIWYDSFDGRKIQAWVQKPPGFDPKRKYPLILNIHGGPHAAYGFVFDHEFQWLAAQGYTVLYANPRGSTSYGQEFGNLIQYKYPGDDYQDLMAGVDVLLRRGYIDEKKLGVTGGSGGGVLTNWTVTHTDRFAAAVSQRDISNWTSWWYSADFVLFQPTWFRAPPFEDPEDYRQRSAITFVKNIHTPIAFILGEADFRTPPSDGGEQLFRALKYLRRPTAMVRFPGESHELSRSGLPWHRIERLQHIAGWFDKFLLGKTVPAYADLNLAQPAPPKAKP